MFTKLTPKAPNKFVCFSENARIYARRSVNTLPVRSIILTFTFRIFRRVDDGVEKRPNPAFIRK